MSSETISQGRSRPGGRSARVQEAVHRAVRELQAEERAGGDGLTVPAIAARAGVTPSTIYRRWGGLAQLLSDVALETMRPDTDPEDTGALHTDLRLWLQQFLEEMSSQPGRAMLRDILGGPGVENVGRCSDYTCGQLDRIRDRALARGEAPPSTEALLDRLVAPAVYRILFMSQPPEVRHFSRLLDEVLSLRRD